MPSLTYQVPNSVWARYEEKARRDGVSVRVWVLWKLKALAADEDDDQTRTNQALESVA